MKYYDRSETKLFVCGDIHGKFKDFFHRVKTFIDNSSPTDSDDAMFGNLVRFIRKNKYNRPHDSYNNTTIIVCGDCGIGFNKEQYYIDLFNKYNETFSQSNTMILFVRGNHDDPSYFDGEKINFSHIKAIPDYSIVKTLDNTTLCVGGAISIDRIWRKQQENIINKYKKNNKKKLYWENENCEYNEAALNEIIDNKISIDSIISHSSPKFAQPQLKPNADKWFKIDKNLKQDIHQERKILENIYNFLTSKNVKLKFWCHGHYHEFIFSKKDDMSLISLPFDLECISPIDTISNNEMEKNIKLNVATVDSGPGIPIDFNEITFDWEGPRLVYNNLDDTWENVVLNNDNAVGENDAMEEI